MLDIPDDATVYHGSAWISQRFSTIFLIPGTEKYTDDDEAPLEAIRWISEI